MTRKIVLLVVMCCVFTTLCYADDQKASGMLVKQGFVALQSGEVERGMDLLNKAIEIQPDNYVALSTLAQAYADFKNEYETALDLFKQTLAIKKDYDMAHFGLGLTYQAMEMKKEAREEFEKTIAVTERPNVKRIAQQALDELG